MIVFDVVKNDFSKYDEYIWGQDFTGFNASSKFFKFFCMTIENPSRVVPLYIYATIDDKIVGVLPSILIRGKYGPVLNSLPWYGSNPGVIANDQFIEKSLLDQFLNIAEWTDCLSATVISRPFQSLESYEYFDWNFTAERIGMITKLPKWKNAEQFGIDLFKKLHSKTRNQLRKSMKNVNCFVDNSQIAFNFLAKTHKENMLAVGAPYKEREFAVLNNAFSENPTYLLTVAREKRTDEYSAGLLLKYYNKTVDYMTPAIVKEKRNLNPLHYLIYLQMKVAASQGFEYWNWGGTMPTGMDGVLRFKRRWGADECKYMYYTKMRHALPKDVTADDLLAEYPYFYVLPFDILNNKKG